MYEGSPSQTLWNLHYSCWDVMKPYLGSRPSIMLQQRLDAWLIINHLGNTWWCKIHNVNIMLRTIFKHSVAVLQLPVSMHFAFIYQLKMHLVWIWKYYAKLQCSCKQIMVLGDSVVLNDKYNCVQGWSNLCMPAATLLYPWPTVQ